MARVIVVGAGVVGLTCAVRLLEAGHRVDLMARDLPLETTSVVAGAFWYPYRALPQDRVTAWASASYAEYVGLAGDPDTGVRMVTGTEVHRTRQRDPWWRAAMPSSLDRETALPEGYADGWTFVTPVVEMPLFLRWLTTRVEELGGTITRMNLGGLPPVEPGGAQVVVNCSGLGARLLGHDRSVVPVSGQVVRVAQIGLDRWWLDAAGPTYIVPRSTDIVVGGTDLEGDWSRTPSPVIAQEILHRASQLVPDLARATVLGHRVGLRPVRPAVRVERVGDVIHCYGHGGAGVTLAWGTADEVAGLVSS
jgi:D-amino-acid oxidase